MSHRSFFAEYIVAKMGLRDQRVVDAFARVERQKFCGPGPWKVWTAAGYIETPSNDAAYLYQDILIGLLPDRAINNGEPSLHARCLISVQVRPGDHVVHVGAGSGYYTAILAELTGPEGMVYGYEIVPELANRARDNLQDYPYVVIETRSGSELDLPPSDVIYVSAGATGPKESWLNALRPEGRLIFPMTPETGMGGMLLISKRRDGEYGARFVGPAMFIPCIGARDPDAAVRLSDAFARGDEYDVRQLHRDKQPDPDKCWFDGGGWWLSSA
jgi:protein-L-isoaspartate(D-aspartate) O-methyltransferase